VRCRFRKKHRAAAEKRTTTGLHETTKQITSSRSTSKQLTRWLSVNITIQNTFSTTMPHKLNIKTQISCNRKTIYIIKFKIYPPLYLNTHMYVFIPFCMLTHITINYFSRRQELIMTFTLHFCIELLLLLSSSTTQYHNKYKAQSQQ
jgi:hypothetical protein